MEVRMWKCTGEKVDSYAFNADTFAEALLAMSYKAEKLQAKAEKKNQIYVFHATSPNWVEDGDYYESALYVSKSMGY